MWPARLYNVFFTHSHKWHDIRKKKITEQKSCVLMFSTTFVWNISHSKTKWAIYYHKCTLLFMQSTRYSCPILMTDFRKILNFKISWKLEQSKPSCSMRTDRQTWRSQYSLLEILRMRLKIVQITDQWCQWRKYITERGISLLLATNDILRMKLSLLRSTRCAVYWCYLTMKD